MPDIIYDMARLNELEVMCARQAADLDGDHMTVAELEELEWQRAERAERDAIYKECAAMQAAADDQTANVSSLGERLAAMRERHSCRGKLINPNVIGRQQSQATSGLDRIKKALAG